MVWTPESTLQFGARFSLERPRPDCDGFSSMVPRPHNPRFFATGFLLAAVFGLAFQANAAAAGAPSAGHFDAEEHARVCRCGERCRMASCCCGRSRSPRRGVPASSTRSAASEQSTESGPCLGESPCSDPAVPSARPPGPSARAAILGLGFLRWEPEASEPLSDTSSCCLPSQRSSRIDRPPRPRNSA